MDHGIFRVPSPWSRGGSVRPSFTGGVLTPGFAGSKCKAPLSRRHPRGMGIGANHSTGVAWRYYCATRFCSLPFSKRLTVKLDGRDDELKLPLTSSLTTSMIIV